MQQIADWLKTLGMSEYAERFVDNKIDISVLPHLTDQDLKDIGVPLGHRRKMLAAISKLAGAASATPEPTARPEPKPQDVAERRQVTVMFSDLVGSTALSARMDPEDLREVISAYQRCVAETVGRFGGFVAKYMGDGVLVYFGYPQAHEDDAERAVRAGLELIAAVAGLKTGALLQTRVGIATGLVVVGDLVGSGEAQERGIVGETPNLAARLQALAEPNTVVIAENTRRLLGNLFDLQDLGKKDLKGLAGPVRAWAALRASSAEGRFEALHTTGLTELVGREEELELLLRRWSKAKAGEGQVVLLSGEAGIGKSRLTAALLKRLSSEPHTRLRYFCSPQHTDSAFYPIISQMERAAGMAHDDTRQAKLEKLDALLAQTATSQQDAALFAEMLSLPNDGRYPAFELAPQQRRQRTLEALTTQIEALTRQNPVLMIFEDAHWTDPTSLEALGRAVDRIWRGSTGSAPPKRWRRSGRPSGGNSRMPYWLRWCASLRRSSVRRSTVSLRPVCCSGRACRRMRPTCSSMLSCRTRPMARCCASRDGRFTPVSPKRSKTSSPTSPRASRSCWHDTAPRPGRSRRPRVCGAKRDSGRWSVRR